MALNPEALAALSSPLLRLYGASPAGAAGAAPGGEPSYGGTVQTALGDIRLPGPTSVGTTGFEDIDALIRARQPEALGLIREGTAEAQRLAGLSAAEIEPLRRFGDLAAFEEQQALLGLSGKEAQRAALAGIPVSPLEQEANRRQMETLLRQAAAGGDISGATLMQSQQLGGQQQLATIQNRLSQLEPLAAIARSTRGTLSQQAEAARGRQAQLASARGTQLANIRLGVAAPVVSSIQQRAELSGLQTIQAAQQKAQMANQLAGLAGRLAPQASTWFGGGTTTAQTPPYQAPTQSFLPTEGFSIGFQGS